PRPDHPRGPEARGGADPGERGQGLSFLLAAVLAGALAQEPSSVTTFHGVAIAPDGRHAAWHSRGGGARKKEPWAGEVGGTPAPRRVTAAKKGAEADEHDAVFSPDGKRLAFLSDAEKAGQAQIWIAELDGNQPPRRVTSVAGDVSNPRFLPDGRSIAF